MTALMLQGTGSHVGKSLLVAGLCRLARQRGHSIAPFKPQNMSNNAAVGVDGGEIGRAQALQAWAAGVSPHTDMNPVLLKPESDTGAHVIVHGRHKATLKAREYAALKPDLLGAVCESFARLKARHDLVIVEGAGSPAEVNLRTGDIANMGFARAADVPVVLVGDIDRGGVIAQIVGTHAVLADADARQIVGFLINKFRGDPTLFDDGYQIISDRTGWRGFGVVPFFSDAARLPAEDALDLQSTFTSRAPPSPLAPPHQSGRAPTSQTPNDTPHLHIACLALSRIANFDDLDPLAQTPGVRVTMVQPGAPVPADAKLIIIPGSKSTRADLGFLRDQGWDIDIKAHVRRGGYVLGVCGGYQMLGRMISDPNGTDGAPGETAGLGLLNITTEMANDKTVRNVQAQLWEAPQLWDTSQHWRASERATGGPLLPAYEIHLGRTTGPDCKRPFAVIGDKTGGHRPDGARSQDGRIMGTYVHGLFINDAFRAAFFKSIAWHAANSHQPFVYSAHIEDTLDALAAHLDKHIDVAALFAQAR